MKIISVLASLVGSALVVCASLLFVMGIMSAIISVDALLISTLWPAVVPKILPGLVAQGFIAQEVSFTTVFWLLFMLGVASPANISNVFSSQKEKKDDKRKLNSK